jgi:AraC-like DNA-binding protein
MLMIVSALGYLVMLQQENTYDEYCRIIAAEQTRPQGSALKDDGPSAPAAWAVMLRKNGSYERHGADAPAPETPRWSFIPGGTQLLEARDTATDYRQPGQRYFVQSGNRNWFQFNVPVGNDIAGIGFAYEHYLAFMHRTGLVLLAAELATWLLLVTLLPLLYYIGIIRPLHNVIRYQPRTEPGNSPEDEITRIRQLAVAVDRKTSLRGDKLTASVRAKLQQVELFIRDNYREDLSREGLAAMVNLDPDYMGRLFRMVTGEKLGDYINNLRIAEAMELLRTTDTPVIDICYQTGFESLRTFNRAFQRVCNASPSEWRRLASGDSSMQH